MPFSLHTLSIAHQWMSQVVQHGDTVLDGTVGNGHDTLFLARLVGTTGKVVGVDIQPEALTQAQTHIQAAAEKEGVPYLERLQLVQCCHSQLIQHHNTAIRGAMFNLGYLPSGNKGIITQIESTLPALEAALSLLLPLGLLTIVCYPGHAGGEVEADGVEEWARHLDSAHYSVLRVTPHNPRTQSPYLIGIQKRR